MDQNQANNLRALADRIEQLDPPLYMDSYHECGTPLCALGHAACMPVFKGQGLKLYAAGAMEFAGRIINGQELPCMALFGLSSHESDGLFGLSCINYWKSSTPTSAEWAAKAREILASHGYGSQSSEDWAKDKVAYVINSQDALIGTDKRDLLVTK